MFALVDCVCGLRTSTALGNEHHVVPRAAGGSGGETIYLCANCHNLIHRLAEALIHNRAADLIDQVGLLHPAAAVQQRLMELAETVAAEMTAARDGTVDLDPEESVGVAFRIPRRLHAAAARDLQGAGQQGRRFSIPGLARRLLLDFLRERGVDG